jgi:hypothetical protein
MAELEHPPLRQGPLGFRRRAAHGVRRDPPVVLIKSPLRADRAAYGFDWPEADHGVSLNWLSTGPPAPHVIRVTEAVAR